jgi:hypothetical protein
MKYIMLILAIVFPSLGYAAPRNIATAPTAFYIDVGGSDANDGLSLATAKRHYCEAIHEAFNNWDFRGYQAFIYPTVSQSFNEMCGVGGVMVGLGGLIIAPNDPANPNIPGFFINTSAAPFVRTCTPPGCGSLSAVKQWCDNFGDLSILIYYSVTFADCNHWNVIGGAAVLMHLTSTGDFFGSRMVISGRGSNDVGFLVDGPGILTIGSDLEINGQLSYVVKCLKMCDLSASGAWFFQYSNVIAPYYLGHGSHADINASYTIGSGAIFTGSSALSGYSEATVGPTPPSGVGQPAWVCLTPGKC